MNSNELRDRAYKIACEHGFHDVDYSDEHWIMLVITELSEAVEADRKGKFANRKSFEACSDMPHRPYASEDTIWSDIFKIYIKDSVEDELADVCIRLLDFAGLRNLNLNRFALANVVTKNKTFIENIYAIVRDIMNYKYSREEQVNYALEQVYSLSYILGIDIIWHIEQKMKYNSTREALHGKKY